MSKYKLLILAFFFLLIPNKVNAIVSQTSDFYVNDSANILSDNTKQYIINNSTKLNSVDGTQIVVVTVTDLEGMSIEDYATKLFRSYGIGDKSKNNGLLLLLALNERKFRVEVGYGLEGILPDGKTGRFQDEYIIPYLKNNEWDRGIRNGYNAFYSEIVKQNNLNIDYASPIRNTSNNYGNTDGNIIFLIIVFGIVIGGFSKKYSIITIIYILSVTILLKIFKDNTILMAYIIINIIGFLAGKYCFNFSNYGGYSGGYSSGGGFSSGGGSFGGGGSSGGGGSTRGF